MDKCPHDGETLKPKDGKSGEIYECPQCQCTFRFILIKWNNKCYAKFHKQAL